MEIADEGMLGYDVCAGPLSQDIAVWHGQSTMKFYIPFKEKSIQQRKSMVRGLSQHASPMADDIRGIYCSHVLYHPKTRHGLDCPHVYWPDLCRDPEWLSKHYKSLRPIIAPQLESYAQLQQRFNKVCKTLIPISKQRQNKDSKTHANMIEWLIDTAKSPNTGSSCLVRRMPFLDMAAIHTMTHTTVNVILDLCHRPEYTQSLWEEVI